MINDKANEPTAIKEIHDIRLTHYEERKNLTDVEKVALINERGKISAEKYGLTLISLPKRKVGSVEVPSSAFMSVLKMD